MNITVLVFSVVLFFALTPGILVTLPKNGGKMTVAAVHAIVFALVFYFSNKLVGQISEGFKEGKILIAKAPVCSNSGGKVVCPKKKK